MSPLRRFNHFLSTILDFVCISKSTFSQIDYIVRAYCPNRSIRPPVLFERLPCFYFDKKVSINVNASNFFHTVLWFSGQSHVFGTGSYSFSVFYG